MVSPIINAVKTGVKIGVSLLAEQKKAAPKKPDIPKIDTTDEYVTEEKGAPQNVKNPEKENIDNPKTKGEQNQDTKVVPKVPAPGGSPSTEKKGFWDGVKAGWDVVTGTVKAGCDAVTGTVKAGWDAVTGTVKTGCDAVTGTVKAGWDAVTGAGKAVLDTVMGAVLEGLSDDGHNIASEAILALEPIANSLLGSPESRPLDPTERQMLKEIFGDSMTDEDYDKVRIREGDAGLIDKVAPGRAFVLGNTIYVSSNRMSNGKIQEETLVHEMVHVWQYQNGGADYLTKALAAQQNGPKGTGSVGIEGQPKDYSKGYYYHDDVIAGTPFEKLNPEQQAKLIADAYSEGVFSTTNPQQFYINGVDKTDYIKGAENEDIKGAWDMIKAGEGAP